MTRAVRTHWLRANASVRTPYRLLVFDTETRPAPALGPEAQTLRLWCARTVRRHDVDPKLARSENHRGHTADELAALVDRTARRDRTLWLFAHNLNFDLAVTALPVELASRGWRLTEGALTSDSPWCRMERRGSRLTIADTWSWLPAPLAELGRLVGRRKPPLPDWDDSDDAWYARCEADVDITARSIVELMDWWDAAELGAWSVTGPACGWSTYRHRRPSPAVLIDPDPDARALEAAAVSGGRREAWRVGELGPGLYADLDLTTAHLTVMSSLPLPARRFGSFGSLPLDTHHLDSLVLDVLAECELETATPRYPWDSGKGTFYPVGRFRTVLAGPELREARDRGELRQIGRGYLYHVKRHMAGWALWLASLIAQESPDVPPTVRLLAKHWSRCVPGKWAGHTSEVVAKIADDRPGWAVERGAVMPGMRPADFLRIGGEEWTIIRDLWADDAFPAVLAWIQAYTRVAVGRLVDELGSAAVSVNTDGILVDVREWAAQRRRRWVNRPPAGDVLLRALDRWCQRADVDLEPFSVRIKGAWSNVTVLGPQHLILGRERRLAGIPPRAVRLANGAYAFTAWPRLRVQLVPDREPSYRTERRTVRLDHVPPVGWLHADGIVTPLRTDVVDGATVPLANPYPLSRGEGLDGLAPVELQHPLLRPLLSARQTPQAGR